MTVSACWSAAAARRQILQLPTSGQPEDDQASSARDARPAQALAAHLAELGCAVLAMRYGVTDDFAIALAGPLYRELALGQKPVPPQALAVALSTSAAVPPTPRPRCRRGLQPCSVPPRHA